MVGLALHAAAETGFSQPVVGENFHAGGLGPGAKLGRDRLAGQQRAARPQGVWTRNAQQGGQLRGQGGQAVGPAPAGQVQGILRRQTFGGQGGFGPDVGQGAGQQV